MSEIRENLRKVAAGAAYLAVTTMLSSCDKEKKPELSNPCKDKEEGLISAQADEALLENQFNTMADSCINHFASQMNEGFLYRAWKIDLEEIEYPTILDSLTTVTSRARNAPEQTRTDITIGIVRTGERALATYPDYIKAKNNTVIWEDALKLCQEQNR